MVVGELKFDTRFLGFMFTLNTVLIVCLELALNMAMSKWSHRASFMLGAACIALGIGGLGLAHSAPALFGVVVLWTFGEMILIPGMADAVAALAAGRAPRRIHGALLADLFDRNRGRTCARNPGVRLRGAAGDVGQLFWPRLAERGAARAPQAARCGAVAASTASIGELPAELAE